MNTVLIAEDEKLIRLGLKTMVQRAPVSVGEILEARDGEEALAILKSRAVDLLITDIRMPRMDGIELVSHSQTLERPPMVIVVSGYDDFNYAVSMMRNGVSEYILKPVERQQFYDILSKMETRFLLQKQAEEEKYEKYLHTLRYLALEQESDSAAYEKAVEAVREPFFREPFLGILTAAEAEGFPEETIRVPVHKRLCLYLLPDREKDKAVLPEISGISQSRSGLEAVRGCYLEALDAWKRSFFTEKPVTAGHGGEKPRPVGLSGDQLLQLMSLQREKEVMRLLHAWARTVAEGRAEAESYALLCREFVESLQKNYGNLILSEDRCSRFLKLWDFDRISGYLNGLDEWLAELCTRIAQEFADYQNRQKIREAVCYIQEHFREPLNMAVVSNQVSMNYSLFSLLFKQYTGKNFVNYLQNLRVNEACRLLEETDWRVNEIGRRSGFTDDKHFLKTFKAAAGMSPTDYRKSKLLLKKQSDA